MHVDYVLLYYTIYIMEEQLQFRQFKWLFNERYRWLLHAFFWIVIYMDEFLSLLGITMPLDNYTEFLVSLSVDMALVYINLYILIPRLLLRNKVMPYLLITLGTILVDIGLMYFIYGCDCYEEELIASLVASFMVTVPVLGTAAGIRIFKIYIRNKQKINALKNENLNAELAYLKDQINPHFLFNALNGIYVQARKRPAEVPESILLLSDLLRYQLYDCSQEQVPLKGEIEYLQNYLELDKMRKTDAKIDFQVIGTPNSRTIAPFVFLPFVENAIKHGVTLDAPAYINIKLELKDQEIYFLVENSKPSVPTQHLGGGIGLANVKRRLKLLYPNRHTLTISNDKELFKVELLLK